jgi:hypothetical protein
VADAGHARAFARDGGDRVPEPSRRAAAEPRREPDEGRLRRLLDAAADGGMDRRGGRAQGAEAVERRGDDGAGLLAVAGLRRADVEVDGGRGEAAGAVAAHEGGVRHCRHARRRGHPRAARRLGARRAGQGGRADEPPEPGGRLDGAPQDAHGGHRGVKGVRGERGGVRGGASADGLRRARGGRARVLRPARPRLRAWRLLGEVRHGGVRGGDRPRDQLLPGAARRDGRDAV